ncbi:MAG: hypothetical protein M0Z44_04705 [Gammaproteobacteria bacterium]|nr:hypothetical protein [Gammaproteobacteria bacterium]
MADMSEADSLADDRVQDDVMRNLEMIGEAVTKFRVKANFCRKADPVGVSLFQLSATIGSLVWMDCRPARHLWNSSLSG